MKLRKALDKAKKERQTTLQKSPERVPEKEEKETAGWVSPVYTQSKSISLDTDKVRENRCVGLFSEAPAIDAYKVLRTQVLLRTREKKMNTVMITGVRPGEGSTLTAVNLALTFAKEYNQTVLLVDADLQQQHVHQYMGFESSAGLNDYLLDSRPLKEIITWPGVEKLTVISGGKTIQESTELLGSKRMGALVQEMKNRYPDRYVFFDVPPILKGADAIAFAPLVDAVLVVVQAGKTPIQDIKKAASLIPKEKFLGFVLNRDKSQKKREAG